MCSVLQGHVACYFNLYKCGVKRPGSAHDLQLLASVLLVINGNRNRWTSHDWRCCVFSVSALSKSCEQPLWLKTYTARMSVRQITFFALSLPTIFFLFWKQLHRAMVLYVETDLLIVASANSLVTFFYNDNLEACQVRCVASVCIAVSVQKC